MQETGDIELLRQYATEGSEEAFAKLVIGNDWPPASLALKKVEKLVPDFASIGNK
jgi:hypothetical protein